MEASKREIKSFQGLCVLAMISLHLFCRLDYSDLYEPWIFILGKPLCYYIGLISDFCTMGFAFCSGYAHATLFKNDASYYRNRLKGVCTLLIDYWVIVIAFCLISLAVGNGCDMPGSVGKFLGNFFLYSKDYNGAWWYLPTYILLAVTSPIVIFSIKRFKVLIAVPMLFIIYTFSYYARFHVESDAFIIRQLYLYGMTMPEYAIGVYFYKYNLFTEVKKFFSGIPRTVLCASCIIVFLLLMFVRGKCVQSLYVAPVTGTVIIIMFHLLYKEKTGEFDLMYFFGNHSTNIWLTHMFFYSNLFVGLVWVAKYPMFVYVLMIVITICVSAILKRIQKPIEKIVKGILF